VRKISNGALKERIPDRLERVEILLDGDKKLGLVGIRDRMRRVEKITLGLILANGLVLLKLSLFPTLDLAAIVSILVP